MMSLECPRWTQSIWITAKKKTSLRLNGHLCFYTRTAQLRARVFECARFWVHAFTSARDYKCTRLRARSFLQVHSFTSVSTRLTAHFYKCTRLQAHAFASARVYKCTRLQAHAFTSARVYKCTRNRISVLKSKLFAIYSSHFFSKEIHTHTNNTLTNDFLILLKLFLSCK
jgi:hypothetical protein